MDTETAIRTLVESLGGQVKTAQALGVKQPTVSGWLNGKHGVSAEVAIRAETLLNGEIKAVWLCPRLGIPAPGSADPAAA